MLVKALPHVGDKHGETVCCAGVTEAGEWRRLFPVMFRSLSEETRFNRWQWIRYRWRKPRADRRAESRHVQEDSIEIVGALRPRERAGFLSSIVLDSPETAMSRGQTLALVRPLEPKFYWVEKSEATLAAQRQEYETAARQFSFLAPDRKTFEPCPYEFKFDYKVGSASQVRTATCDDWETSATFYRLRRSTKDDGEALQQMRRIFGEEYPLKGMVFAMGTHSRFPKTWLLVGVIRLDDVPQLRFDI